MATDLPPPDPDLKNLTENLTENLTSRESESERWLRAQVAASVRRDKRKEAYDGT